MGVGVGVCVCTAVQKKTSKCVASPKSGFNRRHSLLAAIFKLFLLFFYFFNCCHSFWMARNLFTNFIAFSRQWLCECEQLYEWFFFAFAAAKRFVFYFVFSSKSIFWLFSMATAPLGSTAMPIFGHFVSKGVYVRFVFIFSFCVDVYLCTNMHEIRFSFVANIARMLWQLQKAYTYEFINKFLSQDFVEYYWLSYLPNIF